MTSPRTEVISEGDPDHRHDFQSAEWDQARLGPPVTDFDKDHGLALEFPKATYKRLYRCSCGREIVQSERALI